MEGVAQVGANGYLVECGKVHAFEQRGLGKAPFVFVGVVDQQIKYGQRVIGNVGSCEVTTKPGGTCAYCGTYIVDMYNIRSADGNTFHVGSECVMKTGDRGLKERVQVAAKKLARDKRHAREQALLADGLRMMTERAGELATKPHPKGWEGQTLLDWCQWMWQHAGVTGKLAVKRAMEAALGK